MNMEKYQARTSCTLV